jgi:hypothetical protein
VVFNGINRNILVVSVAASLSLLFLNFIKRREDGQESGQANENSTSTPQSFIEDDLHSKLRNKEPIYIVAPQLENIISFPRYEKALIDIKLANRDPKSKKFFDQVLDDLAGLSECDTNDVENQRHQQHHFTSNQIGYKDLTANIEELIKLKFMKRDQKSKMINPSLNDGFAHHISQILSDDLMLRLALKYPHIDNRFFRNEPPTTIEKLAKVRAEKPLAVNPNDEAISLFDDPDYALLFEFHTNFVKVIKQKSKQLSQANKFYSNKELLSLINRLDSYMNLLIVSNMIKEVKPKFNVWVSEAFFDDFDLDFLYKNSKSKNDPKIEDNKSDEVETNGSKKEAKEK